MIVEVIGFVPGYNRTIRLNSRASLAAIVDDFGGRKIVDLPAGRAGSRAEVCIFLISEKTLIQVTNLFD